MRKSACCSPITVNGGGEQARPVGLGNLFLANFTLLTCTVHVDHQTSLVRLDLVPGTALADLDDVS